MGQPVRLMLYNCMAQEAICRLQELRLWVKGEFCDVLM